MTKMGKKVIRKQVFAARKAHTDQQIDDWSRKIAETVTALPEYSNSRRILAYADYNHEVMTKYIIEAAWNDGKEVAVPKVVGQDMIFYKLTILHSLKRDILVFRSRQEVRSFSGKRL